MSHTYVEVWTLRRGIIDPPEPVLPSTQMVMMFEDQRDYRRAREERDPPINWRDEDRRPVRGERRVDEMRRLAERRKA
jgi:hypothetical protein